MATKKYIKDYPSITTLSMTPVEIEPDKENPIRLKCNLSFRYTRRGTALIYCGERIKGINFESSPRKNIDGTIVKGWHDHMWNEKIIPRDKNVEKVNLPSDASPEEIIDESLRRWNIEVRGNWPKTLNLFR